MKHVCLIRTSLAATEHKRNPGMVVHQYSSLHFLLIDFDFLSHILLGIHQYLPGLSPGLPWPGATYDVHVSHTYLHSLAAVIKNLADVFYLCVLMMAYGPAFTRATIHGIIINTVQSVGSLPEVLANGEFLYTLCSSVSRVWYLYIVGKGSLAAR